MPLLTLFNVNAWGTSVTYTFSSASWAASPANWTSTGAGTGFESTGSARGVQITSSASETPGCTSPASYSGGVLSVDVVASSNTTTGKIAIKIGSTTIATKDVANSNNTTYTFDASDYATISTLSGNVALVVTKPSSNSVYVKSIKITYVTEKFTITYNGGSGTAGKASETQGSVGAAIVLPSATPNSDCVAEGWTLAGWATSSCTQTTTKPKLYAAGSNYYPESSHTLYAVYKIGDIYTIDFESAASAYTDWTFTNITSKQTNANVPAYSGDYIGLTANTTSYQTIVTKAALETPKYITFYISKASTNTGESYWKIYVSDNGSDWGDAIKSQDAKSMSKGDWVEVTKDLSDYSNVYVKVEYGTNNAIRAIDDLELSCATYNSNPDCTYDWFIDIMHDNETIEKQGASYSMPAALSDASKGDDYCDEKHYHFLGWVEESDLNDDGTLKAGATLYPAGDGGHTAANTTFYAIWGKEE